jgi:hypothetical protein
MQATPILKMKTGDVPQIFSALFYDWDWEGENQSNQQVL